MGVFYLMLPTYDNVVGNTKLRRGAKATKGRLTVGLKWNATGTKFLKVDLFWISKKSRYFGGIWKPKNLGGLYYHNKKALMKQAVGGI